jgi:formamidopyrimidine-DNA glycosylase
MPEGDTVFRAARTLHRALAGKPVVRFETALAQLSRVDDDAPIAGRTVERVMPGVLGGSPGGGRGLRACSADIE